MNRRHGLAAPGAAGRRPARPHHRGQRCRRPRLSRPGLDWAPTAHRISVVLETRPPFVEPTAAARDPRRLRLPCDRFKLGRQSFLSGLRGNKASGQHRQIDSDKPYSVGLEVHNGRFKGSGCAGPINAFSRNQLISEERCPLRNLRWLNSLPFRTAAAAPCQARCHGKRLSGLTRRCLNRAMSRKHGLLCAGALVDC